MESWGTLTFKERDNKDPATDTKNTEQGENQDKLNHSLKTKGGESFKKHGSVSGVKCYKKVKYDKD